MACERVQLNKLLKQLRIPVQINNELDYNLVTVSNRGKVILRKSEKGSLISAEKAFLAKKGKFIYSRLSIHNGAFGLVPNELEDALLTSEMPIFDINPNILERFFIYSLSLPSFKAQLHNLTKGMGRTRVKEKDFLSLYIDLPDINKQKKIIKRISAAESIINQTSEELLNQNELLKQLRHQFLKDAMHGLLISQNPKNEAVDRYFLPTNEKNRITEELPFEIPKDWKWHRLGEVVKMSRGRFSIRPRNDPRYFNGEYPFIQIGSLDEKGSVINTASQSLNEMGIKVSKSFPAETIVIAIVGGTIGNLGVLGREMYFPDSMIGILPSNGHNQNFILNFLRYKQPEIKSEAYQMAGQPNIKIPTLYNLLIALPPLIEQNRIVTKIERFMELCDELEQNIQQNQKYSQELLQLTLKEALAN